MRRRLEQSDKIGDRDGVPNTDVKALSEEIRSLRWSRGELESEILLLTLASSFGSLDPVSQEGSAFGERRGDGIVGAGSRRRPGTCLEAGKNLKSSWARGEE